MRAAEQSLPDSIREWIGDDAESKQPEFRRRTDIQTTTEQQLLHVHSAEHEGREGTVGM